MMNKIQAIKAVRDKTGLGLAEAKKLVEDITPHLQWDDQYLRDQAANLNVCIANLNVCIYERVKNGIGNLSQYDLEGLRDLVLQRIEFGKLLINRGISLP